MTVKLLIEHLLDSLSLKGGSKDSPESTLVKYHIVGNHVSRFIIFMVIQKYLVLAEISLNPVLGGERVFFGSFFP